MANKPLPNLLPADLPENWQNNQIVAPTGAEVGLAEQYGYNYLMAQLNAAQQAINNINNAFPGLAELVGGKIPLGYLPVDEALSNTSGNPVQNKVINAALASKVPTTRKVNGKALSADISLNAADVGARPSTWTPTAAEVGAVPTSRKVNNKALSADISLTAADVGALPSNGKAATAGTADTAKACSGNSATATTAGSCSGNAATASKLATARSIRTNLASGSAVNFDGSANITPGIQGILGVANGGTGANNAAAARNALGITAANLGLTNIKIASGQFTANVNGGSYTLPIGFCPKLFILLTQGRYNGADRWYLFNESPAINPTGGTYTFTSYNPASGNQEIKFNNDSITLTPLYSVNALWFAIG